MKYNSAIKIHGKNTSRYWSCIPSCTDCCPSGRDGEIFVPTTLFDAWREYALNNPDGIPFYNVISDRFLQHAAKPGQLLEYTELAGLEPSEYHPIFSRGKRCKNLNESATGCKVHGTVVKGPNCLSVPEGNLAGRKHEREMMYKDKKTKEFYPCIGGKILRPEDKIRVDQLWHISQDEIGLSMRLMRSRIEGEVLHAREFPELTFGRTTEEILYFAGLEREVEKMALLTTQALGRIIGQSGLEDELRRNRIEPHEQKIVDGFLETITAKKRR